MKSTTPETSDFYNACLISDIPRVKYYLARMTIDEINRIERNGSTALHTAAYHDNAAVVYLLLRRGALGSIKNRHDLTPFEETTSSYIKQILSNTGNAAWVEWTFVDPPTRETKYMFDSALKDTFLRMGLSFILDYLLNYYARRYIAQALPMSIQKIEQ
jgi:ankyrin repeat protein